MKHAQSSLTASAGSKRAAPRRFRYETRVRRPTDLSQSIECLAARVTATRGLELSAEDRVALDELIAALAELLGERLSV